MVEYFLCYISLVSLHRSEAARLIPELSVLASSHHQYCPEIHDHFCLDLADFDFLAKMVYCFLLDLPLDYSNLNLLVVYWMMHHHADWCPAVMYQADDHRPTIFRLQVELYIQ